MVEMAAVERTNWAGVSSLVLGLRLCRIRITNSEWLSMIHFLSSKQIWIEHFMLHNLRFKFQLLLSVKVINSVFKEIS